MSGKIKRHVLSAVISLMSPEKIISLTYGEVCNSRTFNPITQLPEKDGLFCQRIFGPVKYRICGCGKYHPPDKSKITICPKCGIALVDPKARRQRFGHISLESPVVHPWYKEYISTILAIPPRMLNRIIYCDAYYVISQGNSPFKEAEIIPPKAFYSYKNAHPDDLKVRAETGGEVVRKLLQKVSIDNLIEHLREKKSSRRVRKQLLLARELKKSKISPEWMIMDILLVMPPDLRPVLFLDDGTVASSDVNDLYARVINRNNRLKKLRFHGAPFILFDTFGKKMLQMAVDALFENKNSVTDRSGKRKLKSLSDLISGKEGRIRRNLLGKRVDYSGRSVIAVGPDLKLHQCGLPLELAMDMFRPFVYSRLLRMGLAYSLKHARFIVEQRSAEAVDALEQELEERTVLLNRAPTLHRMGIQAFDPVIVSGRAIKLHPLVCSAFNADFDGDQMGVHIPISIEAQIESRVLMLSVNNIISPASGKLVMAPSQDIVLGIYWLTKDKERCIGEGKLFADKEDALMAHDAGVADLHAKIKVRIDGQFIETTPGRIIFSGIFPDEMPFELFNKSFRKKDISKIIEKCMERFGSPAAVKLLDDIKEMGFKYATESGISLGMDDMVIPPEKKEILDDTEKQIKEWKRNFEDGFLSRKELYKKTIKLWVETTGKVADKAMETLGSIDSGENSMFMMADSGARGATDQIRQVTGMRGLMAKTTGEIADTPIKACFKEGLSYHEFLISSHGARKGRADMALKTAHAGYFTRKLVETAHDIIINEHDCGTQRGFKMEALIDDSGQETVPLEDRIIGRLASKDIKSGAEVIVRKGELITRGAAEALKEKGVTSVLVRSPITCESSNGICAACYGNDLAKGVLPEIGDAVGIIAAQSVGEPGTQLTLRAFHFGGAVLETEEEEKEEAEEEEDAEKNEEDTAKTHITPVGKSKDITGGLQRVLQVLELRKINGAAVLSEIDGLVKVLPSVGKNAIEITGENTIRRYVVPAGQPLIAKDGDTVKAGDILFDGIVDPRDILKILGFEKAALYVINEVQKIYRGQGIELNDKHLEIILRKMLGKVEILDPGDTDFVKGEIASKADFFEANRLTEGRKATAKQVMIGLTKTALLSESWLSAASFQNTVSILADAAIRKRIDRLAGIKENLVVGNLIPAGTGHKKCQNTYFVPDKSKKQQKRISYSQKREAYEKFLSIFRSEEVENRKEG